MYAESKQYCFKLYPEDGWPPAEVENLWLRPFEVNQTFLLKSSPLFVKGVAYDDVVALKCDDVGDVLGFVVVVPSGFSTIWLLAADGEQFETVSGALRDLKWPFEGISEYRLLTIALPKSVSLVEFDRWVAEHCDSRKLEVAYSCLRHAN
jgi:hypothetical protein